MILRDIQVALVLASTTFGLPLSGHAQVVDDVPTYSVPNAADSQSGPVPYSPGDSTTNGSSLDEDKPALKGQEYFNSRVKSKFKPRTPKVHDGDTWKKNPPVWSIPDPTGQVHPYSLSANPAPGGGAYPGGPSGQFGSPYYYQPTSPDTAFGTGGNGPVVGIGGYTSPIIGAQGDVVEGSYGPAAPGFYNPGPTGPSSSHSGPIYGGSGAAFGGGYGPASFAGPGYAGGSTMAALPGNLPGNPYDYHFGPGFYRFQEAGHYRFPYYSYRRPWYFPGHPSYNRDTNIPW